MHSIAALQNKIEQTLKKEHFIFDPKELYEPMAYILSLGGKHLRPTLMLMACDLFGENIDKALLPSLGIELFHNFTLIHDDIMDKAPIRRGKETIYKKWNTNIAILSGDAMMIMAYKFLMQTDEKFLPELFTIFNQVALEVCEGQQYDMNFETSDNVSISDYINMIRLKTAVLLGGSLKIGALIGGASNEDDKENIFRFGENLGIAFQLQDDLLDVFGDEKKFGKKNGGDIVENKKTYLYLKAFELAEGDDLILLQKAFSETDEERKINFAKSIYNKLFIRLHTEEEMDRYYQKALQHLEQIKIDSERKIELKAFAEMLMVREF